MILTACFKAAKLRDLIPRRTLNEHDQYIRTLDKELGTYGTEDSIDCLRSEFMVEYINLRSDDSLRQLIEFYQYRCVDTVLDAKLKMENERLRKARLEEFPSVSESYISDPQEIVKSLQLTARVISGQRESSPFPKLRSHIIRECGF